MLRSTSYIKFYGQVPILILWSSSYIKFYGQVPIQNVIVKFLYKILWSSSYVKFYGQVPIKIQWLTSYIFE